VKVEPTVKFILVLLFGKLGMRDQLRKGRRLVGNLPAYWVRPDRHPSARPLIRQSFQRNGSLTLTELPIVNTAIPLLLL
jgi:hypothetical protein